MSEAGWHELIRAGFSACLLLFVLLVPSAGRARKVTRGRHAALRR